MRTSCLLLVLFGCAAESHVLGARRLGAADVTISPTQGIAKDPKGLKNVQGGCSWDKLNAPCQGDVYGTFSQEKTTLKEGLCLFGLQRSKTFDNKPKVDTSQSNKPNELFIGYYCGADFSKQPCMDVIPKIADANKGKSKDKAPAMDCPSALSNFALKTAFGLGCKVTLLDIVDNAAEVYPEIKKMAAENPEELEKLKGVRVADMCMETCEACDDVTGALMRLASATIGLAELQEAANRVHGEICLAFGFQMKGSEAGVIKANFEKCPITRGKSDVKAQANGRRLASVHVSLSGDLKTMDAMAKQLGDKNSSLNTGGKFGMGYKTMGNDDITITAELDRPSEKPGGLGLKMTLILVAVVLLLLIICCCWCCCHFCCGCCKSGKDSAVDDIDDSESAQSVKN